MWSTPLTPGSCQRSERRQSLGHDARACGFAEASQRSDYAGFDAFRAAILSNPMKVSSEDLRYRGLSGVVFTFYLTSGKLPEINCKPIDLRPDFTFRSPFLNERKAPGSWSWISMTPGSVDEL